jgi:hypothetical protein
MHCGNALGNGNARPLKEACADALDMVLFVLTYIGIVARIQHVDRRSP